MTRRLLFALLLAATFLAGVVAGWKLKDWLDVDACLDSGGAWNYQTGDCRTK